MILVIHLILVIFFLKKGKWGWEIFFALFLGGFGGKKWGGKILPILQS